MKIGIFDSGMGGLIIAHSLIKRLPQYDYCFLGDTARVPYGNRSAERIHQFTKEGVAYLFDQGCQLVLVACNTASAEALRILQADFIPREYPDRDLLGVLAPAAESAATQSQSGHVGVLATRGTVLSGAFAREIKKARPDAIIVQQAAPLLVPLVENDGRPYATPVIRDYLRPLKQAGVDVIVLGCTHYPFFKDKIREQAGSGIKVICQDEVIPERFAKYLENHPETATQLSTSGDREFIVTDLTPANRILAEKLFHAKIELRSISLDRQSSR